MDIGKVIDGLNLSYKGLRNLLIASIGAIASVWIIGNKVGSMTTKLDSFDKSINELKTEVLINRKQSKEQLDRIYNDFLEISKSNNRLWNDKFQLFIEYGDQNRELLIKLLDFENKKSEQLLREIETNRRHIISEGEQTRNFEDSIQKTKADGTHVKTTEPHIINVTPIKKKDKDKSDDEI